MRIFLTPFIIFLALISPAYGQEAAYPPVQILSSDTHTIVGEPIAYPDGEAQITAALITLAPDTPTGWHVHNVPLYAYIIEGEVTVDYGAAHGKKTYRAGDSFMEAMQIRHNGINLGEQPARLLAVFLGAVGVENTTGEE